MDKIILEHIECCVNLNKIGIENVRSNLSEKSEQIIDHTQKLLDIVLEEYLKLKEEKAGKQ